MASERDLHHSIFEEVKIDKNKNCCDCVNKCVYKRMNDVKIEPFFSWVTLTAVFLVNILLAVPEISFGIFYDYLQEEFDTNRAAIGWIFFVYSTTGCILGIVISPIVEHYGCRVVSIISSCVMALGMCLTAVASTLGIFNFLFGLLGGLGVAGLYLVTNTIIQQHFSYNRGLATGIAALGYTAGTILTPVIVEHFLQEYSLSGALLLHGALFVQGIMFAVLFKTPARFIGKEKRQNDNKDDNSEAAVPTSSAEEESMISGISHVDCENTKESADDFSVSLNDETSSETERGQHKKHRELKQLCRKMVDFSIVKHVPFLLFSLSSLFSTITKHGLLSHTVSAAINQGIPQKESAYLFTIMGFSNLVFRIASSFILNFRWVNSLIYSTIGILLLSVGAFLLAVASTYPIFVTSMILMGSFEGLTFTAVPMVLVYIIGVEEFARNFAVQEIITLPAAFVGAPFAAWITDMTGNYMAAFLMLGICGIVSAALAIVTYILVKIKYHT